VEKSSNNCYIKRDDVFNLLREHLFCHSVAGNADFGMKRYFVQNRGIPQGSVLSSILCNFYYGSIEKNF